MKKLPKHKHKYGYPASQLKSILKKLKIDEKIFWDAFGVNTCLLDSKTNEVIYYVCDVERALYNLKHNLGQYHLWD